MVKDADEIDPTTLDIRNAGEWTEAEQEAYNRHVEDRLDEKIEDASADEQNAIAVLRKDAQDTLDTDTVPLDAATGEVELEVRTRFPPEVEDLFETFQGMMDADSPDLNQARVVGCRVIAAMIEAPEKFANPDVWYVASKDGSAGISWLQEKAKRILGPARKNMASEVVRGNSRT